MIELTLNQIKKHSPCTDGWKKLRHHLGLDFPMDRTFPLTTILDSNDLDDAIWSLRCPDDRTPSILFAVGCAQSVMHLMTDQRSIDAVKEAHLYAHGEVTIDEVNVAAKAADAAAYAAARVARADRAAYAADAAAYAAYTAYAAADNAACAAAAVATYAADAADAAAYAADAVYAEQKQLLTRICSEY